MLPGKKRSPVSKHSSDSGGVPAVAAIVSVGGAAGPPPSLAADAHMPRHAGTPSPERAHARNVRAHCFYGFYGVYCVLPRSRRARRAADAQSTPATVTMTKMFHAKKKTAVRMKQQNMQVMHVENPKHTNEPNMSKPHCPLQVHALRACSIETGTAR